MTKTRHPKIFVGDIAGPPAEELQHAIERLACLAQVGDEASIRLLLNDVLREANVEVGSAPAANPAVFALPPLASPQPHGA
jgi:hypothetical protein